MSSAPDRNTAFRPLRIFLVENDVDTLKYFRLYLEESGHTVFGARTQAEALSAIPSLRCDVLISDLGLSDGTGWDLLRRVREETQAPPPYAIAVSGFGREVDRGKSVAAGFRHHLLKPFDLEELDAMLAEAMQERAEPGTHPPT
jgi:DNA-binding response OmpR family regulator